MRGLFLDLSTKTGWALFDTPNSAPKFGTLRLPKVYDPDDYGTRTWALWQWLDDKLGMWAPEIVGFEGPFIPQGEWRGKDNNDGKPSFVTTAQTLRLQISLAAIIETVCRKHRIRCLEVATSSAKVALAGTARLGKKKKRAMLSAALTRGWGCADDHQADAGAVGLVVYQSLKLAE